MGGLDLGAGSGHQPALATGGLDLDDPPLDLVQPVLGDNELVGGRWWRQGILEAGQLPINLEPLPGELTRHQVGFTHFGVGVEVVERIAQWFGVDQGCFDPCDQIGPLVEHMVARGGARDGGLLDRPQGVRGLGLRLLRGGKLVAGLLELTAQRGLVELRGLQVQELLLGVVDHLSRGHALLHTAPNVRWAGETEANPTGYAPICIGTTTSDRMERFTRPLMQQYGVRLVIGKGGLRDDSLKSFAEMGGAYLAIIGGTAALETTWIEAIEDVDLDDLNPESLWKFRVNGFGPLLVAMDSHGASLYSKIRTAAQQRRAEALKRLGVR